MRLNIGSGQVPAMNRLKGKSNERSIHLSVGGKESLISEGCSERGKGKYETDDIIRRVELDSDTEARAHGKFVSNGVDNSKDNLHSCKGGATVQILPQIDLVTLAVSVGFQLDQGRNPHWDSKTEPTGSRASNGSPDLRSQPRGRHEHPGQSSQRQCQCPSTTSPWACQT